MVEPWSLGAGVVLGVAVALLLVRPVVQRAVSRAVDAQRRARDAERMAEIGSMTSGLAHEIKNPLSTIGLNAELLGEAIAELEIGDQDRGPLARRVTALSREADRLRDILEDFLRYAGEIHVDPRPVDTAAVVREFADFFEPQVTQAGGRLVLDAPASLVAVADTDGLKQALLNLSLNALQANALRGDSGGRVVLSVRAAEDEQLGPAVVVGVADEGPGVPEERRAEIFRPYHTTKRAGAGLGLAITRRLIEEMGGRVVVADQQPRGARFEIVLPRDEPARR